MDQPVRHITIVGGGTAGWMSAIMLRSKLDADLRGPRTRITLVESPGVPIIGVGEGTLPGFVDELRQSGIDEKEFLRRCNAAYKLGVRFANWNGSQKNGAYSFIHPFSYGTAAGGKNPLLHYHSFGSLPGAEPQDVADNLDIYAAAIRLKRSPRTLKEGQGRQLLPRYGFHFDAVELADFLKEVAIRRGVEHILDDVDDAVVADGDMITHLRLRNRGLFPVELVLDCTGFKGLLISKVLKEPFEPYSKYLLCDRALALQVPHADPAAMEPCTTATALSAGWSWRIPLFHRVGTGYVFSSAFRSDDQAILEYCRHLKVNPDQVEPRVIPMRVGRSRRAWVGNCIAVGLSGGFIEPLEATAIMTIQVTVMNLFRHFPSRSMPAGLRNRFNEVVGNVQDRIRDFITLHYYLANRSEPFWLAARAPSVLSDTLAANLDVWRHRLPMETDLPTPNMFNYMSYGICMMAKGFYRGRQISMQSNVRESHWRDYGAKVAEARALLPRMPSMHQKLLHVRQEGAQSPPSNVQSVMRMAVA